MEEESGVREGVVALPESVRDDRECSVTRSSLSTFSADCNTHTVFTITLYVYSMCMSH